MATLKNGLVFPQNVEQNYPVTQEFNHYVYTQEKFKKISAQKHVYVHMWNIFHNSQEVQTTYMSINRVLFSHRMEWSADISYTTDKPWKYFGNWKKHTQILLDCKHIVGFHLREVTTGVKDQRWSGAERKWEWGETAKRYRVSFRGHENILKLDSGNGGTAQWLSYKPLTSTL